MDNFSLISIYCSGVLTLFMGIFHTRFFKLFKWEKDFEKISETNKKILYTIHIALLLLFFGIAAISFLYAKELSSCIGLSLGLNFMLAMFWLWRTIWQILYFKRKRGNKSPLHYVLIGYFTLLFCAYILPVIIKIIRS